MRTFLIAALLSIATVAFADGPPQPVAAQQPPDVATLQTQLSEIGCNAERLAAAQEIARLRAQVATFTSEKEKTAKK